MASVKVSNISSSTTEKEIRDFFSFCGKISSLKLDGSNATITFEKESAAKTAILLHDTTLSGSNVHVEPLEGATSGQTSAAHHDDDEELRQEDKPKSRIMVEYLTAGYKLGDGVITKAIEFDNKNGISGRFQNALKQFDAKTGASEKAAQLDKKYDITNKAQDTAKQGWLGLSSYYEKFTGTPTGQRVHQFYLTGAKQVQDVHNEAMRQSGLREKYAQGSSEKHQPHEIDNSGHTTCSCSANEGTCGCKPGQCRCSSCPKNDQSRSTSGATSGTTSGGLTATGDADKIAAASNVAPLGEKKA